MTVPSFLPAVDDAEAYEAIARDEPRFVPGVAEIQRRHGLSGSARRFVDGSLPVYDLGCGLALKLYPPYELAHFQTESHVLGLVHGRIPIPTPRLEAQGELDGWRYVLMGRLQGTSLATAWPGIPGSDRARIAGELGHAIAALHALDVPHLPGAPDDWDGFVAAQRAGAVERQRKLGLPEPWLSAIQPFLDAVPLQPRRRVLLHTEIMREHLLVDRDEHGYTLSGLFDFEPSMLGHPEYELASVGLFVSCGDAPFLRGVLRAAGYDDARIAELPPRLMAWGLLHRYSHLPWYLRRMPAAPGVETLEALARQWWAV